MKGRILIVDDEESILDFLEVLLSKEGYDCFTAQTPKGAIDIIQHKRIDLVITDLRMMPADGISLLRQIKQIDTQITVIMMTAYASIETAVIAMKEGAYDYITKPFKIDEIRTVVANALKQRFTEEENKYLHSRLKAIGVKSEVIGKSPVIQKMYEVIEKIAPTDSTVLIQGESGTGKELVACAVHEKSMRSGGPFVAVNCSALPETLLESELFGYTRGAFTGAVNSKKGLFEVADEGTLFLDEIGEISPAMQIKLLRALEEKKIRPLGSTDVISVDIRLVAATNKNLSEEVRSGKFREDLFYRINVVPIQVPALRERKEDIPLLVEHFLEKFSRRSGNTRKGFSTEAMDVLMNCDWPGNIRELENVVERLVNLTASNMITADDLRDKFRQDDTAKGTIRAEIPQEGIDLNRVTSEVERELVAKALEQSKGSYTRAARILRITPRSFRYLSGKYNVKTLRGKAPPSGTQAKIGSDGA
jgi:two-component system response regulator PilR (NtrC family)